MKQTSLNALGSVHLKALTSKTPLILGKAPPMIARRTAPLGPLMLGVLQLFISTPCPGRPIQSHTKKLPDLLSPIYSKTLSQGMLFVETNALFLSISSEVHKNLCLLKNTTQKTHYST